VPAEKAVDCAKKDRAFGEPWRWEKVRFEAVFRVGAGLAALRYVPVPTIIAKFLRGSGPSVPLFFRIAGLSASGIVFGSNPRAKGGRSESNTVRPRAIENVPFPQKGNK
jgi:hypothetical protein